MKKLIKKIFTTKKQKLLVHDPIQELIARLCDPTDILYDENFVKGMEEQDANRESR